MKFVERTSAPSATNKFYLKAGKGGYNRAMEINTKTHSCLPNCCGMAHGRWLESQNQTNYSKYDKLCTGNARSYYGKKDGYKRGSTPKIGSVICWSGGSKGYGHVAFVEKIYSNGDILTSNSGADGSRYFTKRLYKSKNYSFGSLYKLQGFIYNPCDFNNNKYNLTRLLKLKFRGADVKELQRELTKRGYSVGKCGVDGVFGDDTYKAVKKFQKDCKIKADGVVGKDTSHKLGWLYKGK